MHILVVFSPGFRFLRSALRAEHEVVSSVAVGNLSGGVQEYWGFRKNYRETRFIKIIAELRRASDLSAYSKHPKIIQKFLMGYEVKMGFGLHYGWAIEGIDAVGRPSLVAGVVVTARPRDVIIAPDDVPKRRGLRNESR